MFPPFPIISHGNGASHALSRIWVWKFPPPGRKPASLRFGPPGLLFNPKDSLVILKLPSRKIVSSDPLMSALKNADSNWPQNDQRFRSRFSPFCSRSKGSPILQQITRRGREPSYAALVGMGIGALFKLTNKIKYLQKCFLQNVGDCSRISY